LLLSAVRAGDIYQRRLTPGAKQQRRRSTALSSKAGSAMLRAKLTRLQNTDKVADDLKLYTRYKVDAIH